MHLAIISPFPPITSGIAAYGYHLAKALDETGAFKTITVLTGRTPNTPRVDRLHGVRVERIWDHNRYDASWRIAARLRQIAPDIVWYNHGITCYGTSPLAALCGSISPSLTHIAGYPSVITLHEVVEQANLQALQAPGGAVFLKIAQLLRLLATRADVVCVTLRQHMEWLTARMPRIKLVHIPIGAYHTPRSLPLSDELELLIFGCLAPFKGLELLLEVFKGLLIKYPLLHLTIAGVDNPRFPGYLNRLQQLVGHHPAIRWLDYVPEGKLPDVFARATIVVLPYTATTGASSVLYQAAAWGRPIVASALPELRAAADEGDLHIEFFPSNNRIGLTTALERMLSDPSLRAVQAQHNLQAISDHLTLGATSKAYLRAFRLALSLASGEF